MARKVKSGARARRRQAPRSPARASTKAHDSATRIRALQEQVASLAAELQAVNAELDAFSYSVSHDLRGPVRHIDGFLRLLHEELGAPTPKAAHYMATASGAARRMGALIDDLLAYSRTARQPLELRSVDLGVMVRDMVARYDLEVGAPRVAWRIGQLPRVRADQALLRTVLQHLLSNARKYSRAQPTPRVEVSARAGQGGVVEISISDNGVGFDPRLSGRLFGVFQRLHGEEEFEGNGIGLAIAQRILRRHGQRIWGDGTPGRGAVFTFTLPVEGS